MHACLFQGAAAATLRLPALPSPPLATLPSLQPYSPAAARRSKKIVAQCEVNPDEPTPECVKSFNSVFADRGACAEGSSLEGCCTALAELGSCLDSIVAAMERDPQYADMVKAL